MTKAKRRRPRSYKKPKASKQQKMVDNYYSISSTTYLTESFTLSSVDRAVSRKGNGRKPDPNFKKGHTPTRQLSLIAKSIGGKIRDIDLGILAKHFDNYIKVVNLLLGRIYSHPNRAQHLGKKLSEYRGRAYTLLRNERDLCYEHNDEIKNLLFERLHRNALEQAGRMALADYSRRQLFNSALKILNGSNSDILLLLRRKRIESGLIRRVRDSCDAVKDNGSGWHYTMGVLRQLRFAIDRHILSALDIKINWRGRQRKKVASLLKNTSSEFAQVTKMVTALLKRWVKNGYSFTNPQLRNYSLDFSASTENIPSQGYWFTKDTERDNEILLHLKLPPGVDGKDHEASPYKNRTLSFRFLDWLPRAATDDRRKAESASQNGDIHRVEQLNFRAAKFEDMHQQLMNTIQIQHAVHNLSRLKQRKESCPEDIIKLQTKVKELKESRRSAPPRILLRNNRVILQIPFHSPNGVISSKVLGKKVYSTKAGVDRGLRAPVVISVEKDDSFEDLLITLDHLMGKRERLRKYAYRLISMVTKKKNNWERKRPGLSYPGHILKKDRHIAALWRKIRRLDREVARIIASKTVWFCEAHLVKKVFFEDLRSFQAHAGSKDLSYNLSSNLWGQIIETVRYMRESLGHSKYSIWTVNPRYTSQTCHVCGERGKRVEDETSTLKRKGGEYFYCEKCKEHFHADVNAARNIIHVQDKISSVVSMKAILQ